MVYRLGLQLARRQLAALAGAISLALSLVFWTQTSVAEAYTLNALFLTLVLWLLWRWEGAEDEQRSRHYLLLAALVYGLSLAHHRLMLLLLPPIFFYLWQVDRRVLRDVRLLLRLGLLVAVGLSLYLFVLWRGLAQGMTVREVLWDTIVGARYTLFLGWSKDWWAILWRIPRQQFGVLGLATAAVGAASPALRHTSRSKAILLLTAYGSTLLFCLIYSIPDPQVFLIPCFVICSLWIAAGAATLAQRAGPRLAPAVLVLALLASLLLLTNLPRAHAYADAAGGLEERARELLEYSFEPEGMVVADFETATSLRFLQAMEGQQPDLEVRRLELGDVLKYRQLLAELDGGRIAYFPSAEGFNLTRFPAGYLLEPLERGLLRVTSSEPGYVVLDKPLSPQVILHGYRADEQGLALFWQAHEPLEENYATYVHFFDGKLQPVGQADKQAMAEGSHIFPTSHWTVGQVVQDVFALPPPATAYVRAGMYTVDATAEDAIREFGRPAVFMLERSGPAEPVQLLDAQLGQTLALQGYETVQEGDELHLTLYWTSRGQERQDYSVFVHVVQGEEIVAQRDQQPLGGFFPTSQWRLGEIVADSYVLPLPPDGAEIRVGLYDATTSLRLPLAGTSVDYVTISLDGGARR
jgi:hypothetical protein